MRLEQEIELAQRYLAIEQVRFGDRLRVQWALDPEANGALLPPLLLQPLVENAVRHGVEPSDKGADVRISTQRRGSMVVIKVTNTVPNGQGEQGQGLALRNVRERLDLLHDVHSQFRSALKGWASSRCAWRCQYDGCRAQGPWWWTTKPWPAHACARWLGDCKTPAVHCVGEAANAVQAMEMLQHQAVDVALLDIHMPGADGLALAQSLQSLSQPPALIFVTAHAEHAVRALTWRRWIT